ncbi:MAG: DUF5721 family protein [Lachnospiraceae bacterium]
MVALKIEDIKTCTAKLFLGEEFDSFLVREAKIVTFNSFHIDGHIRKGYYTSQELEENQMESLSFWKTLRPFCFSLIKGKRLPESFHITLQMPKAGIGQFLESSGLSVPQETIQTLCMNIRYEEGEMSVVTATSLAVFTLDKSMDLEWDQFIQEFLKQKGIAFTKE